MYKTLHKIITSSIVFLFIAPVYTAERVKIIAIKSSDLSVYDEAIAGFKNKLSADNVPCQMKVFSFSEYPTLKSIAQAVSAEKPKVLFTMGSSAVILAKDFLKGVPFVFGMVFDPVGNGVEYAGVHANVDPKQQVDFIRNAFPELKRIGVIYGRGKNVKFIGRLKKLQAQGDRNLVMIEVSSLNQMQRALNDIKKQADCLLMIPNLEVYPVNFIPHLILKTLKIRLPVIAPTATCVRAGALAGVYSDFRNNGALAAVLVNQYMSGKEINRLPIKWPTKYRTAVNLVVAERLRVKVNQAARENADVLIE